MRVHLSNPLTVWMQLHHDSISSQDRTEEQTSRFTVEWNKNSVYMHSISGKSLGLKSTVSTDSAKIQLLDNEMQTLKHRIGLLEGVDAKQHIIIRDLFNQQSDLINHNMRNNILLHNIPKFLWTM